MGAVANGLDLERLPVAAHLHPERREADDHARDRVAQGPVQRGEGIQGALSLVASVPTLIVFLLFQRYFIAGMTMGVVKG